MPFITDQELLEYTTQIEEAKEEKRVLNYAHSKALKDERENTKKFKITTMILGILALLGVAGTTYFLSTQSSSSENKGVLSNDETTTELQQKINTLEETIHTLKEGDTTAIAAMLDEQTTEIQTLQQTIADLETQLENAASESSDNATATTTTTEAASNASAGSGSLSDQVVYTVQISAHDNPQLSLYSSSFANLKEIRAGGFYKYSLGNFDSLEAAKQYRNELKKIGIPKTFIASYQYGKRLRIEEVN